MTLTVHVIEDRAARFLEAAVVSGLNVLVAGRHPGRQPHKSVRHPGQEGDLALGDRAGSVM